MENYMNIEQFIDKHWSTILAAILVYILREYIRKFLRWLGEAFLLLLGFWGVHVLLLRRFKKSLLDSFQETRIGYRNYRIDLDRNYITLRLSEK